MSHELKTPIAVLLTEARRLQLQERGAEELSAFVGDVAEQMARLGKIVESFLTLARIDYEERLRKFEDFWFHDLLLEAVRRTRAQGPRPTRSTSTSSSPRAPTTSTAPAGATPSSYRPPWRT